MICSPRIRNLAACCAGLAALMSPVTWAQASELQTGGLSWRTQVRFGQSASAQWPAAAWGPRSSDSLPSGLLLGDYYFRSARWAWSQGLRATGGLYLPGSAPLAELGFGPPAASHPPGIAGFAGAWLARSDGRDSRPYLGLGYSRQGMWGLGGQWGLTADLGLLAEPGANGLTTRRNLDDAVREIRFTPLLQLGVRYAF